MQSDSKIIRFLLDWAEHFYKSKDAFYKKIQDIEKKSSSLVIHYKDHAEIILAIHDLTKFDSQSMQNDTSIITLNNRRNLDTLYQRWTEFSSLSTLKVYFINPFSLLEHKWIIKPYTHARICDDVALKSGLKAMFETVEPLTEEILASKKYKVVEDKGA